MWVFVTNLMKITLFMKYMLFFILCFQSANCFSENFIKYGAVDVQTQFGTVRGTEMVFRGYRLHRFLGIPFAKPPLGDLRFKKPQPPEPWTETLIANTMPPACIQYGESVIAIYTTGSKKSEDCLYLNIWIPHGQKNVPVMFWIYGGYFLIGSNSIQWFKGKALAAIGQVTVVTINYRINAFGFLNSGTEDAPGNVGVDAMKLIETLYSYYDPHSNSYRPNYGDEILPIKARIAVINGNVHDVDVFIRNTKDEGSATLIDSHPELFVSRGEKNIEVTMSLGEYLLRTYFKDFEDPDAIIRHYLGNVSPDDYNQIRHNVYTAIGDYRYVCPTVYFAESYSKNGMKVFFYNFTHRSSDIPFAEWAGVPDLTEVPFVFGEPYRNPNHWTRKEVILSLKIMKSWSNFAKYGTPQSNPLEKPWPQYSRKTPVFTELNTLPGMQYGKGPHINNCNFFRKYFGFE